MEFRERSYSRGTDDKHSRPTTRMNDETWDKFKTLLCGLYRNYPLSIVMNFMEKEYGISQSKRQYGYRFEKWGVRKYNAGDRKAPLISLSPTSIHGGTNFTDIGADFDQEPHSFSPHPLLDLPDMDAIMTTPGSDNMDYEAAELLIQYPWTTGSAEEANKLAADFLAAMLDDKNAFALYSRLHSNLWSNSQSSLKTREFIAISCARVAGKPDNARSARELLEREWPQTSEAGRSESQFVLSMLKAYVGSHQEDSDESTFINQVNHNVRQVISDDGSLLRIPHKYSAIDLVTFFFLNYGFEIYDNGFEKSNPPNVMTEHLLNEFIKRQPFMETLRHDDPSPLRRCVEWCEEQLGLNHPVALRDTLVQPSPDMRCWWHNIRIFCTLWGVMTQLVRANRAPDWYIQCESAFGIPPSELLVTLSWMIRAETTTVGEINSDADLLEHAADGANNLLELDDSKLWITFLDKFTWMNELVSPGEDEKSFETLVQDQLRKYVSEVLRIQLPYQAGDQLTSVPGADFCGLTQTAGWF
ncbi:Ff.00g026880.m01.CDS01 [Fusarium sp. VM40]|nr:Ff.00g026880.m01.CDS01 [Fusarium sp. VM40]